MILATVLVFFAVGLVLPVVRLYRRTRVFGVVLKPPLAAGMSLALFAMLGWGVAVELVDPVSLGILPVPPLVHAAGWGLIALGTALLVAAQAQMGASWRIGIDGNPTGLVTHGLYRWVRNPIYSALGVMLAGLAAVTPSAFTVAAWLVCAVTVSIQTRREERHLLALHPAAWRAWAAQVGRFVPLLGRLEP